MAQRLLKFMPVAFVYIMSNKSHRLYVGATTNVIGRAREHRFRTYRSSFTARYRFYRLVYFEAAHSWQHALLREKQIKAWRREKKVALIQASNPN